MKEHGTFSATEKMMARFAAMDKKSLIKAIIDGYGGGVEHNTVTYWRALPKETLVIVAADMMASDEERHSDQRDERAAPATETAPPTATPEPAPIAAPAAVSAPAPRGYRLRCTHTTGWLRRDQPRKPGDKATYKVVDDVKKASFYRTLGQAQKKLLEVAQLHDDREHQAELEEVSA